MAGEEKAQLHNQLDSELVRMLRDALRAMRFGTVTLIIQDGRVIQLEKNEKFRLPKVLHSDGSGI